jgi:predicted lipid-binding transport protein (Tim44 family)
MRRYGKFFGVLAIGLATMLTLADFAEARRASGGFGSRGTRTFQAPAATRTAPAPAAPIERTMTPQGQTTRPATAPNAQTQAGPGGLFGTAGGPGGLLMGGLFGMLMGSGFGGGFGFLGLLLQGVLIFFLVRFAMRMFGNRQTAYSGAGAGPSARSNAATGPGFQIPRMGGINLGGSSASASAMPRGPSASADEIGIGQKDLERFERLLKEMQAAYADEDYASLRRITTPEAMSYLAEELSENATRGLKNEVRDVHLVQGDVSESWREGNVDYATVAMRYESIDVLRDRTSGKVVSGDPDNVSESTEIWTFVRRPGTDWQISAIQAVGDPE